MTKLVIQYNFLKRLLQFLVGTVPQVQPKGDKIQKYPFGRQFRSEFCSMFETFRR